MRLATTLVTFALAFLLAGCSLSPLDAARLSLGATVAAYDAAEPRLEAHRIAAGRACLEATTPPSVLPVCLSEVRARWAPVRAASERAYRAIVAALAMLHLSEAGAALGQGVDATKLSRAISMAIDAARALEAALEGVP